MTINSEARRLRGWEIESDWITTVGLIILLFICAVLFLREMEHLILGVVRGPEHIGKSFWGVWNKVFEAIAAIICVLLAFGLRGELVRVALILMGMDLASFSVLSLLHLSSGLSHVVAVSGSILRQISFALFCIAIVQWLKSVIRGSADTKNPGGEN